VVAILTKRPDGLLRVEETRVSLKKDYEAVIREAQRQGFRAVKTGRGNKLMLLAPNGVGKIRCAATPSDRRGVDNLIAELRRHGFKWKGR